MFPRISAGGRDALLVQYTGNLVGAYPICLHFKNPPDNISRRFVNYIMIVFQDIPIWSLPTYKLSLFLFHPER